MKPRVRVPASSSPTVAFAPAMPRTPSRLPPRAGTLVAHSRNDITIPHYTDTLRPTDATLIQRGGGRGLELYADVERDAHAYAVLQKRKHQLVAREWEVRPVTEEAADVAVAGFVREVLEAIDIDRLSYRLLDATLYGYAVAEVVWKRDGARIVPAYVKDHDPRRFVFDHNWRPRLLTLTHPLDGEELPPRKFIVHRFDVRGNDPYGLGLGTRLFWLVLFKREGLAFWLKFLEKYAAPTPVGRVPEGMLPHEQRQILEALENMVNSGAITVPVGTELEFMEATRSGPASYEQWSRYLDEQISECVLGNTLSTNIGAVGSKAAAETHQDEQHLIIDADADLLSATLHDTLLRWLVELNFPGRPVPHVWRLRPKDDAAEGEARKMVAEAEAAEQASLRSAIQSVRDMQPAAAIETLKAMSALAARLDNAALSTMIAAADREPVDAPGGGDEDGGEDDEDEEDGPAFAAPPEDVFRTPFLAGEVVDALVPQIDRVVARWLRGIRDALAGADTLAGVQARLPSLPSIGEDFVDVLADAIVLANLIGRASVVTEAEEDGLTAEDLFGRGVAPTFAEGGGIEFKGAPFRAAIEYLLAKTYVTTRSWRDLNREAHNRAFTVAGEMSREVLADIRAALDRAMTTPGGRGYRDFRRAFEDLVRSGKWTADPSLAWNKLKRAWRAHVIWQTNLANSHAAGRRAQQLEVADVLPFWQYRHAATRTPKRPRMQHLVLDGLTLPVDDPTWSRIYAPNGYYCSCAIRAITRTAANRVPDARRARPGDDLIDRAVPREWQHPPQIRQPGDGTEDRPARRRGLR